MREVQRGRASFCGLSDRSLAHERLMYGAASRTEHFVTRSNFKADWRGRMTMSSGVDMCEVADGDEVHASELRVQQRRKVSAATTSSMSRAKSIMRAQVGLFF